MFTFTSVMFKALESQYDSMLMITVQQSLVTTSSRGLKEQKWRRTSRKCAVPRLRVKQESRGVTVPVQTPVSVTATGQGYRHTEIQQDREAVVKNTMLQSFRAVRDEKKSFHTHETNTTQKQNQMSDVDIICSKRPTTHTLNHTILDSVQIREFQVNTINN